MSKLKRIWNKIFNLTSSTRSIHERINERHNTLRLIKACKHIDQIPIIQNVVYNYNARFGKSEIVTFQANKQIGNIVSITLLCANPYI
jgi:hypothetical protein